MAFGLAESRLFRPGDPAVSDRLLRLPSGLSDEGVRERRVRDANYRRTAGESSRTGFP